MPDFFAKLIRWWLLVVCWVTFAGFVGALLNTRYGHLSPLASMTGERGVQA